MSTDTTPDIPMTDAEFFALAQTAEDAMRTAWSRDPRAEREEVAETVHGDIFGTACNAEEHAQHAAADLSDAVWDGIQRTPRPAITCDGSGLVITARGYESCDADCTACIDGADYPEDEDRRNGWGE